MDGKFAITRQGFNLIAKWGAGAERIITYIWVGDGRVDENGALFELTDLISPKEQATGAAPVIIDNEIQLVIEYRNDLNGGLATGFWLNEYGIFATDPDLGRILLAYGTLGDYPEWCTPISSGIVNVRRYPISIGVSGDGDVTLSFPTAAFVTHMDLTTAIENAASGIEMSDADIPETGTKIHFRIMAEA